MGEVLTLAVGPGGLRDVLLSLANHAYDDGSESRPGLALLMWETGLSRRQVIRLLKQLEELGAIVAVAYPNGGRSASGKGRATEYRLCLQRLAKKPLLPRSNGVIAMAPLLGPTVPYEPSNGAISASNGAISASNSAIQMSPQPSSPAVLTSVHTSVRPAGARACARDDERLLSDEKEPDGPQLALTPAIVIRKAEDEWCGDCGHPSLVADESGALCTNGNCPTRRRVAVS
jgi:hypothetical protein